MEFGITLRASLHKESMTQGATDSAPAEAGAEIPVCGYWGFSRPTGLGTGVRTGGVPAPLRILAGSVPSIDQMW